MGTLSNEGIGHCCNCEAEQGHMDSHTGVKDIKKLGEKK